MESVTLQHTSLHVSRLCFGTMTFGKPVDQAQATALIHRSIDAGIHFFDTANAYQSGLSETMLGHALKGRRHQFIVATKVWARMGEGPDDAGLSKRAILKAVEDSLRRLQTDYVDLYYLHQPDYAVPIEESLDALHQLVQSGKVRYPASSNYAAWQVAQMQCIAKERGYKPATVSQALCNLIARGIEQEFTPMARHYGVSIIAYNPLAGGLLTGKHQPQSITPGTRFDNNKMYQDRYWHPQDFEAVSRLGQIARDSGRSLISLALCWLLHHTPVSSVILGATRMEQLDQNLAAAAEGPLSADTLAACDQVWQDFRGPVPSYNR
jgi:aryl-alcohol dehydrogenase-like predicted oxidoreductase